MELKTHCLFEDFENATLEMDDQDDYTAGIDMLDETYNSLFPDDVEESDVDDDVMPDETFQILAFSDNDDKFKRKRLKSCVSLLIKKLARNFGQNSGVLIHGAGVLCYFSV